MRPWSLVRAALLSLVLISCELATEQNSKASKYEFSMTGNNQAGNPGTLLPLPLHVQVMDDKGKGVKNRKVTFSVASGGGSVQNGAVTTDANGVAEDRWTVGMAGDQTVEVKGAQGPSDVNDVVLTTFTATLKDVVPPTVTINQAAGQADPTSAGPIKFTVVFSEAVTGFTSADVSFGGTTAG